MMPHKLEPVCQAKDRRRRRAFMAGGKGHEGQRVSGWCHFRQRSLPPGFAKAAAQAAGVAIFVKVNTDEQPQITGQFRVQDE
jgi:hypothetical protein